jgi:Ca-activated chloride channel family protein
MSMLINGFAVSASADNDADEVVLFIVDFSESMVEKFRGVRKIDMLLSTLNEILPQIPENKKTGLRVYGHTFAFTPMQACKSSKLAVPIREGSVPSIQGTLFSLKPRGWTPITYSLKQAVTYDLAGFTGKKRIILLSDGGENCDESPCDYAMELIKMRDDISIDVIAFAIADQDANNQLKCTALVTSGKFYTANTAAELKRSLSDSVNAKKEVQGRIITH